MIQEGYKVNSSQGVATVDIQVQWCEDIFHGVRCPRYPHFSNFIGAMCNTHYHVKMALSTTSTTAASITKPASEIPPQNRLFRPWDATAVPQRTTDKNESSAKKRNKRLHLRKDNTFVNSATLMENTAAAISPIHPLTLGSTECVATSSFLTPEQNLRLEENCAKASAVTADAFYADLSRADLARLGLLCPADYARLKARKQRPKKYRCPHCHVAFSNNGQLRGHIRIHTGERPFACQHDGCGKAFTRNEELTRHRRIHSGVRPYPCPTCGKRFGRKDHLKKHARTHQKVHHHASSHASAVAAAAAFNAAAVGLFPLDPIQLPSFVPFPYPGVFGF